MGNGIGLPKELFTAVDSYKEYKGILPNDTWVLIQQLNYHSNATNGDKFDVIESLDENQKKIFASLKWSTHLKWYVTDKSYDHADELVDELNDIFHTVTGLNTHRIVYFLVKNSYKSDDAIAEYAEWRKTNSHEIFTDLKNPNKELLRLLSLLPDGIPSYHDALVARCDNLANMNKPVDF